MKTIEGRYFKDSCGWKYVVSGKTVYTIGSSLDWGCVTVGGDLPYGGKFTEEMLREYADRCDSEGTFQVWE